MTKSRSNGILIVAVLICLSACASRSTQINRHYVGCADASAQCSQQEMLAACTATANRYPYLRDRLLYREYSELMTEDAVFQIEGRPEVIGREAIVDALRERGPSAETRHFSRLVNIQSSGFDTATGLSYVTI